MQEKRIWIICHYATPLKYGHGARHFLLAEEFVKNGYEVTIFASASNFQLDRKPQLTGIFTREVVNGVEVIWIRGLRYTNPSGFARVISWFVFSFLLLFYPKPRHSLPGILIVSSLSLIPVINGILIKFRSKTTQFIFEVRDIWPQTLIDIGGYSRFHPLVMLLGMFEKAGYLKADIIVATMPRADLHIAGRIRKKFNFSCIPQGYHPQISPETASADTDPFASLSNGRNFIVGYAGALGKSNCLETLIQAAELINKRGVENICFAFLGEGNATETLKGMASEIPGVVFFKKVPKHKVPFFLQKCTVVYDSVKPVPLYNYGLSRNKWMDYMLCAKPLIVSYSGYVSLINEADCGTVVPAGDASALADAIMDYYRKDRSELEEKGKRGRDFVLSNRSFSALAANYISLFRY